MTKVNAPSIVELLANILDISKLNHPPSVVSKAVQLRIALEVASSLPSPGSEVRTSVYYRSQLRSIVTATLDAINEEAPFDIFATSKLVENIYATLYPSCETALTALLITTGNGEQGIPVDYKEAANLLCKSLYSWNLVYPELDK